MTLNAWRSRLRAGVALLALLGGAARAGDLFPVQEVRFSADGRAVLVVTAGVQDGSGFPVSALAVYSTVTGARLAAASRREEGSAEPSQVTARLLGAQRSVLGRHGLLNRPVATARYRRTFAPFIGWADGLRAGQAGRVDVPLWSRPVPVTWRVYPVRAAACPAPTGRLALLPPGERVAGVQVKVNAQVVHADAFLPCSREGTARYTLDGVYVQGNRAAVLMRGYRPGFEGPDADLLVIATTLR